MNGTWRPGVTTKGYTVCFSGSIFHDDRKQNYMLPAHKMRKKLSEIDEGEENQGSCNPHGKKKISNFKYLKHHVILTEKVPIILCAA